MTPQKPISLPPTLAFGLAQLVAENLPPRVTLQGLTGNGANVIAGNILTSLVPFIAKMVADPKFQKHLQTLTDPQTEVFGADWKALPPSVDRAVGMATQGLFIDGGHHKQWFLEQVLEALGVELDDIRQQIVDASNAAEPDEDPLAPEDAWEAGIAP